MSYYISELLKLLDSFGSTLPELLIIAQKLVFVAVAPKKRFINM